MTPRDVLTVGGFSEPVSEAPPAAKVKAPVKRRQAKAASVKRKTKAKKVVERKAPAKKTVKRKG